MAVGKISASGKDLVPSAGIEPASTVSETGTLSIEL